MTEAGQRFGLDLTYEYYDSGRPERIRGTAIGSSEGSLTLAYDDDGNAKQVEVNTSTGGVIAGNAFDLVDGLTSSSGTAGDYSYQFDAASNVSWLLADSPLGQREQTRLYDNANDASTIERTVVVDGAPTTETLSARYDELGNLIFDGQDKAYVYDDFGRLHEVWIAGEHEDRLSYDAAGRLAEGFHGPTGQTRTAEMAGLLQVAFSGPAGLRRIVPSLETGMAFAIIEPYEDCCTRVALFCPFRFSPVPQQTRHAMRHHVHMDAARRRVLTTSDGSSMLTSACTPTDHMSPTKICTSGGRLRPRGVSDPTLT